MKLAMAVPTPMTTRPITKYVAKRDCPSCTWREGTARARSARAPSLALPRKSVDMKTLPTAASPAELTFFGLTTAARMTPLPGRQAWHFCGSAMRSGSGSHFLALKDHVGDHEQKDGARHQAGHLGPYEQQALDEGERRTQDGVLQLIQEHRS